MAYHRRRSARRFGLRRSFKRRSYGRRTRYNPRRRSRRFIKGRSRTGGYYGRYPVGGVNAELKFHDDPGTGIVLLPAWDALKTSIVDVPQGTGESERIGRRVTMKSVNIKGWMIREALSNLAVSQARVRLALVQDKQTNGALTNPLDVWNENSVDSYRNLSNVGRFNILYDKTFTLNVLAAAGNGSTNTTAAFGRYFKISRKINMPIEFDGPTGGISELQSNNLVWFAIFDGATTTTINFNVRVRYTDA